VYVKSPGAERSMSSVGANLMTRTEKACPLGRLLAGILLAQALVRSAESALDVASMRHMSWKISEGFERARSPHRQDARRYSAGYGMGLLSSMVSGRHLASLRISICRPTQLTGTARRCAMAIFGSAQRMGCTLEGRQLTRRGAGKEIPVLSLPPPIEVVRARDGPADRIPLGACEIKAGERQCQGDDGKLYVGVWVHEDRKGNLGWRGGRDVRVENTGPSKFYRVPVR